MAIPHQPISGDRQVPRNQPAPAARPFAMSVDVEDYLHTWALSPVIKRDDWDRWPSRVEAATMRIIDLFDRHQVKSTFFMLGWVAKRAPMLVREIVARGHELASHG
ncbi:MAG: polysaccharide deacetylase family protein, partial [Geminicoccaceae bacterium]